MNHMPQWYLDDQETKHVVEKKPYHPHATFYKVDEAMAYIEKHGLDAHIWSGLGDGKHHVMLNN